MASCCYCMAWVSWQSATKPVLSTTNTITCALEWHVYSALLLCAMWSLKAPLDLGFWSPVHCMLFRQTVPWPWHAWLRCLWQKHIHPGHPYELPYLFCAFVLIFQLNVNTFSLSVWICQTSVSTFGSCYCLLPLTWRALSIPVVLSLHLGCFSLHFVN